MQGILPFGNLYQPSSTQSNNIDPARLSRAWEGTNRSCLDHEVDNHSPKRRNGL